MRVICVGSSAKDIFFPIAGGEIIDTPDDLTSRKKFVFELGAKYKAEDRFESLGGCAANVASGLSRLGIETGLMTKVGGDYLGNWIIDELKKEGISQNCVEIEKNSKSDISAIIVDEKSGEHTIFFNRDANEKLEVRAEKMSNSEWVFVSDLNSNKIVSWQDNLEKITEACKAKKIKLAINPGQANIKEDCPKMIDAIRCSQVLMLNKDEAIEILSRSENQYSSNDLDDEKFLLLRLKEMGPDFVTLTDGARGAWAYDGKGFIFAKASTDRPVETTGAGDAFSSGFLAAYIKGKGLNECLVWGIANSGNSLLFYGAVEGLLEEDRMEEKIKEIKIEKS